MGVYHFFFIQIGKITKLALHFSILVLIYILLLYNKGIIIIINVVEFLVMERKNHKMQFL